jgi:putative PIN family toxin of toxin-antitoxin system
MTVCLDTNTFLQIFGRRRPFYPILRSLLSGNLALAASTAIMLEYEEVTVKLSGLDRWRDISRLLEVLTQFHGNIHFVEAQFRFGVITADPDDNKFCDCAIAANAEFIITEDRHFEALKFSGYKPKPISPDEFIRAHFRS